MFKSLKRCCQIALQRDCTNLYIQQKQIKVPALLHTHSLSCIGEGTGNPLQCSCLGNPRDGGAWRAAAYAVTQRQKRVKEVSWRTGRRQWHPTPVLLPGKPHGRRSLVGCSPWGRQELDTLSDFTFTLSFHALEKEMATHSSVLAWRIPGKGEPGGLPSMESHRVKHD